MKALKQLTLQLSVLFAAATFCPVRGQTSLPLESIKVQAGDRMAEKVYVHLDRPTCFVGETIWFKMWVTDENLQSSPLSSIGYLEVVNHEGEPAIQVKIALKNGRGDGSVRIPSDIATGTYLVRAYTSWMKNFPEDHFFESSLTLINPFSPMPVSAREEPGKPDLQFFPEGGHALAGIENKIAFRGQTLDGKGFDFRGKILDENGNTVASFQPVVHGIGHFLFTPQQGKQYRVEITDASGNIRQYPFVEIRNEGYTLRLKEEADRIQVEVTRQDISGNFPVYLLLYQGENSSAYRGEFQGNMTRITVDKSKLRPGVNVLTLFDSQLQPIGERLYFHRPGVQEQLRISSGKTTYSHREKVSLELSPGWLTDTLEASVAVYLTDDLPETSQPSIDTWLLFTSEIKGQIENPEFYFSGNEKAARALDDVMLTHGWRRYKAEALVKNEFEPRYLPEPYGHLIQGQILSRNGNHPLPNRPILAAHPSAKAMPWVGVSDANGRFTLETKDFTGSRELVIQTNFRTDSLVQFILENPFAPVNTLPQLPALALDNRHQKDILKRSINMQTLNSYFPALKPAEVTDTVSFYGKPDFHYLLDDYTRFPTMEEVLSEYVPPVMIRLRRGKYYARVMETGMHRQYFTEDPLLIFDGIPVFDTDRIMQFDPLKVKRIEVVNHLYHLGPLTFPGIVSFHTYNHDLAGFEIDPKALVMAYEGVLEKREFYAPVYDRKVKNAERMPDFRNLLFWSPSVRIAPGKPATLDFYTSDQTGRYKVVLQGLTFDGTPLSATAELQVTD